MVCGMALCSRFMRRKTPGRDSERGRGAHSSAWQPCGFQGPRLILQKFDGVLAVVFELNANEDLKIIREIWMKAGLQLGIFTPWRHGTRLFPVGFAGFFTFFVAWVRAR